MTITSNENMWDKKFNISLTLEELLVVGEAVGISCAEDLARELDKVYEAEKVREKVLRGSMLPDLWHDFKVALLAAGIEP